MHICLSDFSVAHGGRNDVTTHVSGKRHKESASAASTSRSVASFFKPQVAQNVIEAETRWSMYVAKHNLALLNSEHDSKLFAQMFPDSEIAR